MDPLPPVIPQKTPSSLLPQFSAEAQPPFQDPSPALYRSPAHYHAVDWPPSTQVHRGRSPANLIRPPAQPYPARPIASSSDSANWSTDRNVASTHGGMGSGVYNPQSHYPPSSLFATPSSTRYVSSSSGRMSEVSRKRRLSDVTEAPTPSPASRTQAKVNTSSSVRLSALGVHQDLNNMIRAMPNMRPTPPTSSVAPTSAVTPAVSSSDGDSREAQVSSVLA